MAGGDFAIFSLDLPVKLKATGAVNSDTIRLIMEAVCRVNTLSEKLNLPSERLLSVPSEGVAYNWARDSLASQYRGMGFGIGIIFPNC